MFSPSDFRNLFQPCYCQRRVWLAANRPDLAAPDIDFVQLMQEKGIAAERHRNTPNMHFRQALKKPVK